LNRPGFIGGRVVPAAFAGGVGFTVGQGLGLNEWNVYDRGVEAVLIEPVDPRQGCQLELARGAERAVGLHVRNSRPRRTLGWRTPAEALDEYIQSGKQAALARTR